VRKTPQDKKRLSYAKDCRNTYGENDKSARRSIPRAKARQHRANRRVAHQVLTHAGEDELGLIRPRTRWRKSPDTPLGQVVATRLEARESRAPTD
jgi:hypothetical protein